MGFVEPRLGRHWINDTQKASETVSSTPSELPHKPTLRHLEFVWLCAASAVFLWLVGIGFAIADAVKPDLPDPLINGALDAASVLTLVAFGLRLAYSRQTENAAAHDQFVAELARMRGALDTARGALDTAMAEMTYRLLARELAQRETVRRLTADPARGAVTVLDRSEYWNVYEDVMRDLGGLGGNPEPPEE